LRVEPKTRPTKSLAERDQRRLSFGLAMPLPKLWPMLSVATCPARRGARSLGKPDFHENLTRDDKVVGSSDRVFGITLAGVAAVVGAFKLWQGHGSAWWWLIAAAVFLLLALFWTAPLRRLNHAWMRFGLALYRVVNPVVMALLFFVTVVPMGLAMRAFGRDALRLKRDKNAASYWILREPPGPSPETMKHQF
jgi:hypothetical protein